MKAVYSFIEKDGTKCTILAYLCVSGVHLTIASNRPSFQIRVSPQDMVSFELGLIRAQMDGTITNLTFTRPMKILQS